MENNNFFLHNFSNKLCIIHDIFKSNKFGVIRDIFEGISRFGKFGGVVGG